MVSVREFGYLRRVWRVPVRKFGYLRLYFHKVEKHFLEYCSVSTNCSRYVTRYLYCSRDTRLMTSCYPLHPEKLFVHATFRSLNHLNFWLHGVHCTLYLGPSCSSIKKLNCHLSGHEQLCHGPWLCGVQWKKKPSKPFGVVMPKSGSVRFFEDFREPGTGPTVRFRQMSEPWTGP